MSPDPIENAFGRDYGLWLADLRKARGMDQRELARVIGVSQATVHRWEAGTVIPNLYHGRLIRGLFRGEPKT